MCIIWYLSLGKTHSTQQGQCFQHVTAFPKCLKQLLRPQAGGVRRRMALRGGLLVNMHYQDVRSLFGVTRAGL